MLYKDMDLYHFNKEFDVKYGKKLAAVYKITNLENGKFYFGRSEDVKSRWSSHVNDLKKNKHGNPNMQSDFNFYKKNINIFDFTIQKKCYACGLPYEELVHIYKYEGNEKLYNCIKPYEKEYLRIGNFLKDLKISFSMFYQRQYDIFDFIIYKRGHQWEDFWEAIIFDNSNNKSKEYRSKIDSKIDTLKWSYREYEVMDISNGYPSNEEIKNILKKYFILI